MPDLVTTGVCPVCRQEVPLKLDGTLRRHRAAAQQSRRARPARCFGTDRAPTAVHVPPAPCQCRKQIGRVEAGTPNRGRFRSVYTCGAHLQASREYVSAGTGCCASDLIPFPAPRRGAYV